MKNRQWIRWVLVPGLILAGIFAVVNSAVGPVAAQGNRNYPEFVTVNGTGLLLQATVLPGSGPLPGTGNSFPVYLYIEAVRNPNIQPPFTNNPDVIGTYSVTSVPGSQAFSQSCLPALGGTEITCTLTPAGPTWVAGQPIAARVQASDAAGFAATALIVFRTN